jgi:ABC-type bacteriocin/lantibiotic exporter with double-glycine peptidase domain
MTAWRFAAGWLCLLLVSAGSTSGCASEPSAAGEKVLLALEHQRQELNQCIPTDASMILAFYGEKHDPAYLKELATPPDSAFPGTYMKDMVAGAQKLGYRWDQRCFSNDAAGFEDGLAKLKESIRSRQPVIVGLPDAPIGHSVVLVGIDGGRSRLTFMDSSRAYPGLRSMSEEKFASTWRERSVNLRCAIFTRPRS